jgi:hypothetical protein
MKNYTFLALGDSYTIGEQVLLSDAFPYQTVQLLRSAELGHLAMGAPEIVAKTGFTTDELLVFMGQRAFLPKYDVVSLLIGVNNQYRGRPVTEFKADFSVLLQKAILFAGGNAAYVFVLSIPDWGATPFAAGKGTQQIADEIDSFNEVCKSVAGDFGCVYIDITNSQRADSQHKEFLAGDELHPSGHEYAKWAVKLASAISQALKG